VNESHIIFKPLDEKTISFGLKAIKNVGTKALENILAARKEHGSFKTLFDFCVTLDLRLVNRKVLESLVATGAMDSLEGTRGQKFQAIETVLKYAQQTQIEKEDDQCSLFDSEASEISYVHKIPSLPDVSDWSETEKLDREKELMGFYLTGHPLLKYADELENFSNFDFTEHNEYEHGKILKLGGMIQDIRHHFDKKNQQMVFFSLDCLGGKADILVFHDLFNKHRSLIQEEQLVFIKGRPTTRMENDTPKIIAEDILSLEELQHRNTDAVNVLIEVDKMKADDVDALYALATKHSGNSPLLFHIYDEEGRNYRILAKRLKVSSNNSFLSKLKDLYGNDNVWTN